MLKKYFLIVLIGLIVLMRLEIFMQPVGTDEGIFFHFAQELANGKLPYSQIADHKEPLVLYWYATIFKFFPDSVLAQQLIELFFFVLVAFLFYFFVKGSWGKDTAQWATVLFAIGMNAHRIAQGGNQLELYVVFFDLLALSSYFLWRNKSNWLGLFVAGLCFGLGFQSKFVALFSLVGFLVFLFTKALVDRKYFKAFLEPILVLLGWVIPTLVIFAVFSRLGILNDYIQVNYVAGLSHVESSLNLPYLIESFSAMFQDQFISLAFGWLGVIVWLVLLFKRKFKKITELEILLGSLFVFQLLAVSLSLKFYGHYFMQIVPVLCILAAQVVVRDGFWRKVILALAILAFLFQMLFLGGYLFKKLTHQDQDVRREVGLYLRAHSAPGELIYVNGLNSAVYFYAQRSAPIAWNHENALKRNGKMLNDAITQIKISNPRYLVFFGSSPSAQLLQKYADQNYLIDKQINEVLIYRRK